MNVLIVGQTGQVATELIRRAPADATVTSLGREVADLGDPGACAKRIAEAEVDLVINAAAYTAVDQAESEEALAHTLNAEAPGAMARAAAARDRPFLHISTDYVFDGSGTQPWKTTDATAPLGAYGRTKLAGEQAVRAAGGRHAILRTAWVVSAHGKNFVKTLLRLAETKDRLTVVADQIGCPTPAAALADALWAMARRLQTDPSVAGTYHFAGSPPTSWADFARAIFDQAGRSVEVVDIPTSAWPTPAPRPLNSRLDTSTTRTVFGIEPPDWRVGLTAILTELGARPS